MRNGSRLVHSTVYKTKNVHYQIISPCIIHTFSNSFLFWWNKTMIFQHSSFIYVVIVVNVVVIIYELYMQTGVAVKIENLNN